MANRKNFPPKIKNSKLKHLETKYDRVTLEFYSVCGGIKMQVLTYAKKEEVEVTNKGGQVTIKPKMNTTTPLYVIRKPNDSVFKTTQPAHIVV